MSRYDNSWDFTTSTDEYLVETFNLFASGVDKGQDVALMLSGMKAIVDESHGRALLANVARTPRQAPCGRKVCTAGVTTPNGEMECGAAAVTTWGASYGGIILEEGRCLSHA
jgi:hypothetical protein